MKFKEGDYIRKSVLPTGTYSKRLEWIIGKIIKINNDDACSCNIVILDKHFYTAQKIGDVYMGLVYYPVDEDWKIEKLSKDEVMVELL